MGVRREDSEEERLEEREGEEGEGGMEGDRQESQGEREEAAGLLAPGREEGEVGPCCGVGAGVEGHLWMEEEEELGREKKKNLNSLNRKCSR